MPFTKQFLDHVQAVADQLQKDPNMQHVLANQSGKSIPQTTMNRRDMLDAIQTELTKAFGTSVEDIYPRGDHLVILMPDGVRFQLSIEDMERLSPDPYERTTRALVRYRNYVFSQLGSEDAARLLADLEESLDEADVMRLEGYGG